MRTESYDENFIEKRPWLSNTQNKKFPGDYSPGNL